MKALSISFLIIIYTLIECKDNSTEPKSYDKIDGDWLSTFTRNSGYIWDEYVNITTSKTEVYAIWGGDGYKGYFTGTNKA
jgi:hypothetical protein